MTPSEPNSPTTASRGYPKISEEYDADLKCHLMKIIETFKEDIHNSLKEIQETTGKQVEALNKETNKSLKEIQENTIKLVKELNNVAQDLKIELETVRNHK